MALRTHHVAAIRGATQGSGILLSPRLVLTAAHVGGSSPEAAVLDGTGWARCITVWRSTDLDAALLLANRDLVPANRFAPLRWGAVRTLDPVPGCHLTGFPLVGRDEEGRLDTVQVPATLAPATGRRADRQTLLVQQYPPRTRRGTDSPWSGLSGAGVVFRDRLIGIAVQDRQPDTWQHSQFALVPTGALLGDPGFCTALDYHLDELPELEGISATDIADRDFERDYARAVEADYGRIRIFGLRQAAGHGRRGWDLTTSYLSLEIRSTDAAGGPDLGPQRAERVLRSRRRVLIRGEAGSGKTTLVQWLAVGAMNGTLGAGLEKFNHRVPLVLQLRKLYRKGVMAPRPEEFLALDDRMCADRQPVGWAHRVLAAGRALLLVDGLDEVPGEQRDEALGWLDRLLDHYPDTWTLATVRPSAVPHGWLGHLGFDELQLCPMNRRDRGHFIERWHRAALQELLAVQHTDEEAQRWRREIDQDRTDLLRTLDSVPEIAQLTDSPLLCAMICALNRESDGALPRHRMALYRDAMSMMLVKRDEGRRVQGAEQLQASEEEQLAMLRRIAHWLVRNNQSEGRRRDAVAQIGKALRDLPGLARRTGAERAYLHVLNRTGLITETGPDTFQFVHRTFQDYLAAMEFREENDFGLLAGHAADEQWGDVIRMTVGHCGRRERAELLTAILDAAETAPPDHRPAVHLLAASCLPSAPELDGKVRRAILDRLRQHLPALLAAGPAPAKLAVVGEELTTVVRRFAEEAPDVLLAAGPLVPEVLALIGGDEALDVLGTLAELPGAGDKSRLKESARPGTRTLLEGVVDQWQHFGIREFSRRVVARADLSTIQVQVTSSDQIPELLGHSTLHRVLLSHRLPVEPELWNRLAPQVKELSLSMRGLSDISFLRHWGPLDRLSIYRCPDLVDLTPLSGLSVRSLYLHELPAETRPAELHTVLGTVVGLDALTITAPDLASIPSPQPVEMVWYLNLSQVPTDYPLDLLGAFFPALEFLALEVTEDHPVSLDLTPLADFPNLKLLIVCRTERPQLTGQHLFPAERLTVQQRDSR
ncbi:NACHT domain-containing protein [Kitasatospora griseola]|uniref:NACHT domain-containing protein n=1 Tax=Kitasatospora griseola TaxID=2064 RepID=UPI00382BB60D